MDGPDPAHREAFADILDLARHLLAPQEPVIRTLRHGDAVTARLRLFILAPEARGMGLGQRLHDACLRFARQAGFRRMVLWTRESHVAACAPYARNGWRLVGSVPAKAYGQDVVDQVWEITL